MAEEKYFQKGISYFQTKRVSESCPFLYRVWMFKELERVRNEEHLLMDYFQIFRFSLEDRNGKVLQRVEHEQEQPPYKKTYYFEVEENGLQDKIYIIDDEAGYATMIFADEY